MSAVEGTKINVTTMPDNQGTASRSRAIAEPYLDHVRRNKAAWERWAPRYMESSRTAWEAGELRWGMWGTPESELQLLNDVLPGADVIELGCGTGATSAALVRLGMRPVGVDIVRPFLEKGAELEQEFGLWFPLLCANAEKLHYGDESFDCAISEYGASIWCDPYRWVREAHRLLRSRGVLVFVTSSALMMTCTPTEGGFAGDRLIRDYFDRSTIEFPGEDGAIEFHLTHAAWVRLLRETGFVIERLIETRPETGARPRFGFVAPDWARRWPSEEIWVARKQAGKGRHT